MRPTPRLRPFLVGFLLHSAACAADATPSTTSSPIAPPEGAPGTLETHLKRTIQLGASTPILVQTFPMAICTLHPSDPRDEGEPFSLNADDDGFVQFYASAPSIATATELPAVTLDCAGQNGTSITHTIELRVGEAAELVPLPARPPHSTGTIRPALTGDLGAFTQAELVSRGYPPRPDAAKYPAKYAQWLDVVSRPYTVANSRKVPLPQRTSRRFGTGTSGIWSGAVLNEGTAPIWQIEADWPVPTVQSPPRGVAADAAEWIGLDNAGNDLLQSGTESFTVTFLFGGIQVVNYYAWIETLPAPAATVADLPVSPGDVVSVDIFVADSHGQTWFRPGGLDMTKNDSVWFMLNNSTTGRVYWGTESSSNFTGTSAEYIIERATPALANFTWASMHDCYFTDSFNGFDPQSLDYNGSAPPLVTLNTVNMVNSSGTTLDIASVYANHDVPAGGNILWLWQNLQ